MLRRRAMMFAASQSPTPTPILPDEYQQVEYLESKVTVTAGPFFNTGYTPTMTGDLVLETDCMIISHASSSTNGYPISSSVSTTSNSVGCGIYFPSSDHTKIGVFNGLETKIAAADSSVYNTRYYAKGLFRSNGYEEIEVNGLFNSGTASTSRTYSAPVCLFGTKKGTSNQLTGQFRGRIYYVKITENGAVKRELYPCYRKSDNEPGFFDLITQTFKTRLGSSTAVITVGPEVN